MKKLLSDGTPAEIGLKVELLKTSDGHKKGKMTTITKINGMTVNKHEHNIDLSKWKNIVECEGWLVHVQNLKHV
jgi:hypothetical protein